MPLPAGLYRCTFQTRLGGSEIALYGFHLQITNPVTITDTISQAVVDKARDQWLDKMSGAKPYFPTSVVWEQVRLDLINNQEGPRYGKVLTSYFAPFSDSGANSFRGTAPNSLPWASSCVVSYAAYAAGEFGLNHGRYRGRYYLPPFSAAVPGGGGGEMPDASTSDLADMVGAYHEAMNDEIGSGFNNQLQLAVVSTIDDTARRARQVWVDSKLDTQRRRENRQPASFKYVVPLDD